MVASHIGASSEDAGRELAAAIVGLVDGVFVQWSLEPDAFDPGAVFDAFLGSLIGLASTPADGGGSAPQHDTV
jgi:hypothetical protein